MAPSSHRLVANKQILTTSMYCLPSSYGSAMTSLARLRAGDLTTRVSSSTAMIHLTYGVERGWSTALAAHTFIPLRQYHQDTNSRSAPE